MGGVVKEGELRPIGFGEWEFLLDKRGKGTIFLSSGSKGKTNGKAKGESSKKEVYGSFRGERF